MPNFVTPRILALCTLFLPLAIVFLIQNYKFRDEAMRKTLHPNFLKAAREAVKQP